MVAEQEHRDPTRHYEAIELAYREERWQDVLQDGRTLLEALEGSDEPLAHALRLRVLLLQAHALLHGLGDRDGAEDLYRAVLTSREAEPALRQSAEQGLQQCNLPVFRPSRFAEAKADTEAEPDTPAPAAARPSADVPAARPSSDAPPADGEDDPAPMGAGGRSEASNGAPGPKLPAFLENPAAGVAASAPSTARNHAMPWLAQSPAAGAEERVVAEVVHEPEQIEVHQADPSLVEPVDLTELPATAASGSGNAALEAAAMETAALNAAAVEALAPQEALPAEAGPSHDDELAAWRETGPRQSPSQSRSPAAADAAATLPEEGGPAAAEAGARRAEAAVEAEGSGGRKDGLLAWAAAPFPHTEEDGEIASAEEEATSRPQAEGEAEGGEEEEEDPDLLDGLLRVVLR